jgi:SAM-dependent methyltransferase
MCCAMPPEHVLSSKKTSVKLEEISAQEFEKLKEQIKEYNQRNPRLSRFPAGISATDDFKAELSADTFLKLTDSKGKIFVISLSNNNKTSFQDFIEPTFESRAKLPNIKINHKLLECCYEHHCDLEEVLKELSLAQGGILFKSNLSDLPFFIAADKINSIFSKIEQTQTTDANSPTSIDKFIACGSITCNKKREQLVSFGYKLLVPKGDNYNYEAEQKRVEEVYKLESTQSYLKHTWNLFKGIARGKLVFNGRKCKSPEASKKGWFSGERNILEVGSGAFPDYKKFLNGISKVFFIEKNPIARKKFLDSIDPEHKDNVLEFSACSDFTGEYQFEKQHLGKFDVIRIVDFAESLSQESLETILKNCWQLLKPGGIVVFAEKDLSLFVTSSDELAFDLKSFLKVCRLNLTYGREQFIKGSVKFLELEKGKKFKILGSKKVLERRFPLSKLHLFLPHTRLDNIAAFLASESATGETVDPSNVIVSYPIRLVVIQKPFEQESK